MRHCLKCGWGKVSVHTDLLLAMRGEANVRTSWCDLNCLYFLGQRELDSRCLALLATSPILIKGTALAEYGRSCKSVMHYVGCEGDNRSIRKALFGNGRN